VGDFPAIARDLFGHHGPGADQTHVAAKNVEKLGQLVETGPPQRLSNRREAWIILQFLRRAPFFGRDGIFNEPLLETQLSIDFHCSEFQAFERLPAESNAPVAEKYRTAITDLYHYGNRGENRR
jgi:hypothetical protein